LKLFWMISGLTSEVVRSCKRIQYSHSFIQPRIRKQKELNQFVFVQKGVALLCWYLGVILWFINSRTSQKTLSEP
jgi:hypothetical protein